MEERIRHMDATLDKVSNRLEAWDKLTVVIDMNNREFPAMQKKLTAASEVLAAHSTDMETMTVRLSRTVERVEDLEKVKNRAIAWVTGAIAGGSFFFALAVDFFRTKFGF
jgi:uncharacterized coiled-coil protein SlyX